MRNTTSSRTASATSAGRAHIIGATAATTTRGATITADKRRALTVGWLTVPGVPSPLPVSRAGSAAVVGRLGVSCTSLLTLQLGLHLPGDGDRIPLSVFLLGVVGGGALGGGGRILILDCGVAYCRGMVSVGLT